MKVHDEPRIARTLLRRFIAGRYREDLEGDLLEELAAGRSSGWYWRQVVSALCEHACFVVRQQVTTFLAATLFFFITLWIVAPATYPIMDWALAPEPLRMLVLTGWLAGVPLLLGGIAGAVERRRRIGAILLGAAFAYLTPVTLPFHSAVCDLCASPASAADSGAVRLLTLTGSALLAGVGAWAAGGLSSAPRHTEH